MLTELSLRLLIVEDSTEDAQLVIRELERSGFTVDPRVVDSEEDLDAALRDGVWDAVVSDYAMPQFDGLRAAEMVRIMAPDTPFIFVSGVIGQERAVEAMRRGVRDYLPKGDLGRLSVAVDREVSAARARKSARLAEEASRRFAEAVVDAMPVPVVTLDSSRKIVSYNPAFSDVYGQCEPPSGDVKTLEDVCPWLAGHPEIEQMLQRVIEHGAVVREVELSIEGDSTRHVVASAKPLPDDIQSGRVVLVIEDVTHRRRLLEQMMSAQRIETVGRLAGGIAHDFNNMLTVVQSFASFLLDDRYRADYTPREVGEVIIDATERAARLTAQLLAFGRQQVQRLERVDLNRVVLGVQEMIERLIGDDVHVSIDLCDDLRPTKADLAQIEQCLLNLVLNARDALPGGGTIHVTTGELLITLDDNRDGEIPAGEWVVLSVTDNGEGMDQATQQQVFDPFFTTKEFGRGTGLGLSTVYGSVRQVGGHVQIFSEPGKGTTINLVLPAFEGRIERSEISETSVVTAHIPNVLLVEDDDLVREATRRILERYDFEVIEARDAAHALEAFAANKDAIDVLVTDIVMPGLSGTELAKKVLAENPGTDLRIVFTSGYSAESVFDAAEFDGRAEYIQKPFLPRQLVELISRLLAAHTAHD